VSGQVQALPALSRVKSLRYPLDSRLGEPQSRFGPDSYEKNMFPVGNRNPVVQHIDYCVGVKLGLTVWVSESRVLRRLFRSQKEVASGAWRKFQNDVLHNFYSMPDIIIVIKSRRMGRGL
jgi:hypothetical protein